MQTTPTQQADMQAAIKKTLHSAAFAKFMGAAVQTALDEAKSQPAGIVLMPKPTTRVKFNDIGCACSYTALSADGNSRIYMQRNFQNAEKLNNLPIWYGSETHTDTLGSTWSTSLPYMVQDDFGNLVEVQP